MAPAPASTGADLDGERRNSPGWNRQRNTAADLGARQIYGDARAARNPRADGVPTAFPDINISKIYSFS